MPMTHERQKTGFVETKEYKRFQEFCNDCRRNRYIGLCYGPPGIGKTLSARRYTLWDEIDVLPYSANSETRVSDNVLRANTIFYTAPVSNTPGIISKDLNRWRERLRVLSRSAKELMESTEVLLEDARRREQKEKEQFFGREDFRISSSFWDFPRSEPTVRQIVCGRYAKHQHIRDPTELIVIDEADRLKIQSLEQVRNIFDNDRIGLVLIGMPGLEKQLARYPQLYSRIGFVHEYGLLSSETTRALLHDTWLPDDIVLPDTAFTDEEGIAAIIRITQGNFRRLFMLLMQIARIMELNSEESVVTLEVVTAARAGLVIGLD
jgi:DNA transposition AAA+ family ATPase